MKSIILAALLILGVAIVLSRFLFIRKRQEFPRLMAAIPADHDLCALDQCIKEVGHIWFFYSLFRKKDPGLLLTVSLNVPCPQEPEDLEALDREIRDLVADLQRTAPLTRSDWREMEGPLAMRLYLEFDWHRTTVAMLREFQGRTMEIIRRHRAEDVVRHFRGSGDYDIYYSEQVGNIIERSLDMVNAFDIRKYSFKSEGLLGYDGKNEQPVTPEEFNDLFEAGKPDIDTRGLTVRDLPEHFRQLYRDEVILVRALLYKRGRKQYLEGWYRDRNGIACNWNIEASGGSWWVYSVEKGELGEIFEMDTEEEACDLFVRYVVEGIQDAEDNEG